MQKAPAFIAPLHGPTPADAERTVLWVSSPSGHYMLLSGSWTFRETARLFAIRCGYRLIPTEAGLAAVEHQMAQRSDQPNKLERIH